MKTPDEIVDKLMNYESNIAWYDIFNEFGNIETDSEARKSFREYIMQTLQNTPEDIINDLKNEIEDFELDESHNYTEELGTAKELIKEIEDYKQSEEDLEM